MERWLQTVAGNAGAIHAPATCQGESQHDQRRQRQTVRAQRHRLPATSAAVHLPAACVMRNTTPRLFMAQPNLMRSDPQPIHRG